jgi:lipid A 4'-phosphatase
MLPFSIRPALIAFIRRPDVLALAACVLAFTAFPQIDVGVAAFFYTPDSGFYLAKNPLVLFSYQVFARIQLLVLGLLLLSWLATRYFFNGQRRAQTKSVLYLLLLLLIGPGLVVNAVLKEEWGRARPREVVEFGGQKQFTPALVPTTQCATNCSFVSGHAAMGFYPLGMAWATGRRRWLAAGILTGALVGAGRILQGGHFLSDVIFAFWVVYITAQVLAYLMALTKPAALPEPAPSPHHSTN